MRLVSPCTPFPTNLEVRVPPCAPSWFPYRVAVGYVHATHKPDFAVYDDDLAVVPVVHLAGEDGKRHPQESMDLDAGFRHFLKEAVFYIPATHIIIKYTYLLHLLLLS